MSNDPPNQARNLLHVKLGDRLEAQATGWGVAVVPVVILLILLVAIGGSSGDASSSFRRIAGTAVDLRWRGPPAQGAAAPARDREAASARLPSPTPPLANGAPPGR